MYFLHLKWIFQSINLKILLAPMGVLAPGYAHGRPSAQPPIYTNGNFPAHVSLGPTKQHLARNAIYLAAQATLVTTLCSHTDYSVHTAHLAGHGQGYTSL